MILGLHQPQYLPWLGYLDKIAKSDIFVFIDDVQYKKREFQNRNRIKTPDGALWLTVPVIVKGKYYQNINEVKINNEQDWRGDHLQSIRYNYSSAKHFERYYHIFEKLYSEEWESLLDLNMETVRIMLEAFGIKKESVLSSSLSIGTQKTERLIDICTRLGADVYLSGQGARDYMDEEMFRQKGIRLVYQEFVHPEYTQNFGGFISHLSALDYLFNCGGDLFGNGK
ncbi:MAG: WbqC family protein [Elusimicrobia bacterium]|nr:WbqC family protein [Elusimicrobiota bacterium]